MRYAYALVLALVLASPAGAQQSPLTLGQALELARVNSPLLPVAGSRVRVAEGTARERAVPTNPVVELRQENLGGTLAADRYATITLPIDLTFQRSALVAAGRQSVAAAMADSSGAAREVDATVGTRYWGAALAEVLAESAALEEAALEELLSYEQTRLREGAISEAVTLRAELELGRARLATASARAAAEQAHAQLAQAVGLPAASLPRAALEASPSAVPVPTAEEAVRQALLARPEVEAARRRVEAAGSRTTAARRGSFPDIGLQVGAMESAGGTAAVMGLSIELPLRDQGGAARARASGEQALALAELEAVRRSVEAEVTAALAVVRRLAEANPDAGPGLAERGAEVVAIAEMAYREGAITLVELLDARRANAAARTAAATRAAELAVAGIELARSLGAPIEEGI